MYPEISVAGGFTPEEAEEIRRRSMELDEDEARAMNKPDEVSVMLCGVHPKEPHPTEFSADGVTCPKCGAKEVSRGYGLAGGPK